MGMTTMTFEDLFNKIENLFLFSCSAAGLIMHKRCNSISYLLYLIIESHVNML